MVGIMLLGSLAASGHVQNRTDMLAGLAADHAILVDPVLGFGPGEPGEMASILPDDVTGVASVGKTWALHMALHALDEGLVTPGETVTVGASAMARPFNWVVDTGGNRMFQGEQFTFWDAVMGGYVRSANDLTTAFAEHIGLKLIQSEGGTCTTDWPTPTQNYPSTCMVRFLLWADLHVHDIGASASTIITAPHIAETVTMRDVALWFDHAVQDPDFRDWASRTSWVWTNLQGNKTYAPNRGNLAITGVEAWKHGNTALCNGDSVGCLVASANRIGRRLISVVAQSTQNAEVSTMLDWGYQTLFHPWQRGPQSAPWGAVKDHALACVGPGHGVSALITPAGNPRLLLWGQGRTGLGVVDEVGGAQFPSDFDFGILPRPTHPFPGPQPVGDLAAQVEREAGPALAAANGAYAPAAGAAGAALVQARDAAQAALTLGALGLLGPAAPKGLQQVEVASVGADRVVVAYRYGFSTLLSSWKVVGDELVHLDSGYDIGMSTDVQLAGVDGDNFVVVAQDLGANVRVGSFRLTATGQIDFLHAAAEAIPGKDFSVGVIPGNSELALPTFVAVAARGLLDGPVEVHAWKLAEGSGALTFHDSHDTKVAGDLLRLVPMSFLPKQGEAIAPPGLTLAYRVLGQLAMVFLTVPWDGDAIVQDGARFDLAPLGEGAGLEAASLGPHSGLLTATRASAGAADTMMTVWEARRDEGIAVTLYEVVDHPWAGANSLQGMCRVRNPNPAPSEGDYLLADLEAPTNLLELRAFRSGPRA